MKRIKSLAISIATVLVLAILVSVLLPVTSRQVLAAEEIIKVSSEEELQNIVKSSENAGKTVYLTTNLLFSSNLEVYYPIDLNLNGYDISFANECYMFIYIPDDYCHFSITGVDIETYTDDQGMIYGNIDGSLVCLEKGYLDIQDVYISNSNSNGSTLNANSNIYIFSGTFKSAVQLSSKIKQNLYSPNATDGKTVYVPATLYVANKVVSERNCADVLGDNVFLYDNSTKTLMVNGDSERNIISHIDDLTINITKESKISNGHISFYGSGTITGGNKLTISDDYYCINQFTDKEDITIKDVSIEINEGVGFSGNGATSGDNLIFDNAEIVQKSGKDFIDYQFPFESVTLKNCEIESPAGAVVKNGQIFEKNGTTEATNVTIKASDYWNPVEYTWNDDFSKCTAKRISKVDASKTETETVTTTSTIKTPATASTKGTTTYTATFLNKAFATQTKDVQNIPVLNSEPSTGGGFEDFVERLYTVALNRASEPEGKAFWCEHVGNGDLNGAQCANEFLLSKEFNDRKLSDEEFLKVLYKTFFDRNAADDPDGFNFWMNSLKTEGRDKVVDGFINSTEWCNICASYGVKSGATRAKATIASKNATDFATRLYTECLGREAEEGGLKFWSLGLTNLELTGKQAAHEFFFSKEFNDFGLDNEGLLTRMYKTFMGREPDTDGMNYWLNNMKNGMTKEDVFNEFVKSKEFTEICQKYAIDRG